MIRYQILRSGLFDLAVADENITAAARRVARQRDLISRLRHAGHPTELAETLLAPFEQALTNRIRRRDQIVVDFGRQASVR